jgi:teichuronic acid biosynthesis glycosyltransferase TuaC
VKMLTFTTLYPNEARPSHGLPVETRLRHLLKTGQVETRVLAPVPWFPSAHSSFRGYAVYARAPHAEIRGGIRVLHPRYPLIPKVGMTVAPVLLARAMRPVVARLLDEFPFEFIDAHYFYPDGVAAVMLGRYFGKPVIVTGRGTDLNVIPEFRVPRRMIQWAAHHAAGIVTVCEALKTQLVGLGVPAQRIRVLRNGVDLDRFRPVDRDAVRDKLRFTGTTLLSVGDLLPLKGHDVIIRALQLLPHCNLVIAGQGPEHMNLVELARTLDVAQRVTFAGVLSQEDLRQYYGAADILVLASSREGWANVLVEALACGTAVIATNVGGTAEIITSPSAGLLLDQCTPVVLAEAVNALLERYPSRAAIRRHAEQFSWRATTEGQLDLFRTVLGMPRMPATPRMAVEA